MQQSLNYLEQYTSGEPRNLVRSCFHMSPEKGYKEAKEQLEWHFGNTVKITEVSKSEPSKNKKQSGNTTNGSDAFVKPCMFCNKNHPMEVCEVFQNKPNKEKMVLP